MYHAIKPSLAVSVGKLQINSVVTKFIKASGRRTCHSPCVSCHGMQDTSWTCAETGLQDLSKQCESRTE